MNWQFFLNSTKGNCKNDHENDHASFNQTNELIGYQNLVDFCEISPMAIVNAMPIAYSLLLKLDRLIKK